MGVNRNSNGIFSGIKIPDMYSIAKIVAGTALIVFIVMALVQFLAVKTVTDAATIDELLAEADVLVIVQPGTTTEYEIPVSEQVNVGLDGRKAGVTEYLFKSHSDSGGGLAVTGFTYLGSVQEAGKHVPGEQEIIVAKSPLGDSMIVLNFVGSKGV